MKTNRTFKNWWARIIVACALIGALSPGLPAKADESAESVIESPFKAGLWTVNPFASVRVHDLGQPKSSTQSQPSELASASSSETGGGVNERLGGGVEIGYALTRNLTLAAEMITENAGHSAIDEAGLNLKWYLPLGNGTGLAPYGLIGASKAFEGDRNVRMNAGAGIELRAARHFSFFADGRWTHDFENVGHALFRAGLGARW